MIPFIFFYITHKQNYLHYTFILKHLKNLIEKKKKNKITFF